MSKVTQFYNYAHYGNYAEEQAYYYEKKAFEDKLIEHNNALVNAYNLLTEEIKNAGLDVRKLRSLIGIIDDCTPEKFK